MFWFCSYSAPHFFLLLKTRNLVSITIFSSGVLTTSIGLGYSWDRLEIGGALSSSMVHMGLGLLFTEGQPLIDMVIGTALGGVDTYIRYDLFPSPKYELSLGMAAVATYSLLGASDITVASGTSMRASYSTKKGAKIFVESSLPIYGLEYTDSCIQASEGGGMETESVLEHGLLLFNKDNNYTFELLITTRIGMEMLF